MISFDEYGNVKNYKGYPLMEIYQYKISNKEQFKTKTNQMLKIGDLLKYQYLIANIPTTKRIFKIENIGLDNTRVQRAIRQNPPIGIDVEEILTQKGINTIRAIVQYKFNDKKKTVINDTVSFEVEVH